MANKTIRYAVCVGAAIVATFGSFTEALAKEYSLAVCENVSLDRISIKDYVKVEAKKHRRPRIKHVAPEPDPTPTPSAPSVRMRHNSRRNSYKMFNTVKAA